MNTKIQSISINTLWHHIHSRPLVRDTITTTFFSTAGKSVAFLIPFFVAAWFGVTSETDAFFFAYGLILFLSGIFAPVVESVIVPYIAEARAEKEDVGRFVRRILGVSGIGLLLLSGIVLLVAKPVLSLITRFDLQGLNLLYRLLAETAPLIILLTWTSILAGTLNAYKKFVFPAISPGFRAIVTVSIIFVLKDIIGVHAIAWGYVAGEIVRLAILVGAIRRLNLFPLSLSLKLGAKLQEFFKTASYQVIGMAAVGLNPLVDKIMASWLGAGRVSVLHYADRLYMIPSVLITTGLVVTILSHWSETYYIKGKEDLRRKVGRMVKIAGAMAMGLTLFLIIGRHPIVAFAFGRGVFPSESLNPCADTFAFYMIGFPLWVVAIIYTRAHMVMKNTLILMKLGILGAVLNFFLNLLLMRYFAVQGIALSTSIVYGVIAFFLWADFSKAVRQQKGIGPV